MYKKGIYLILFLVGGLGIVPCALSAAAPEVKIDASKSAKKKDDFRREMVLIPEQDGMDPYQEEFLLRPHFKDARHIGGGACGIVVSVFDQKLNKMQAVKKIKLSKKLTDSQKAWANHQANEYPEELRKDVERVMREIQLFEDRAWELRSTLREIVMMRHIKHRNIVSLNDVYIPGMDGDFDTIYLVSDLELFDLKTYIEKLGLDRGGLTDWHCRYFLFQILLGVDYLHRVMGVLHADLKPGNLLIDEKDRLKIADFGLARVLSEPNQNMDKNIVTLPYRAPELLRNGEYGFGVDIWSVGAIFAEMLSGRKLFNVYLAHVASSRHEKFAKDPVAYIGARMPSLPEGAMDLLTKLLAFDPQKRISALEALKHPYFDEIRKRLCPVQMKLTLPTIDLSEVCGFENHGMVRPRSDSLHGQRLLDTSADGLFLRTEAARTLVRSWAFIDYRRHLRAEVARFHLAFKQSEVKNVKPAEKTVDDRPKDGLVRRP